MNIDAIAIHPTEEQKALRDSTFYYHYSEVKRWAEDMIEGGLGRICYQSSGDEKGVHSWYVAFLCEDKGCVFISSTTQNAFETMNLVHDAFIKGRA